MRQIAGIAILTAAISSPLAAADIDIRDFRMAIGVSPGPSSTHVDTSASSGTVSSKSAQSLDLYGGFAGGEIHDYGIVYGIGLDAARGTFSPRGSGSLDYTTVSPQVRAGLGYALSTSFHLEITPFLGYGLALVEWPKGAGSETDTGTGTTFTYGVLVSGLARLGEGWRIGVDAGYQGGLTTASVDTAGGSTDLEMHCSGVTAHLVAGYQF